MHWALKIVQVYTYSQHTVSCLLFTRLQNFILEHQTPASDHDYIIGLFPRSPHCIFCVVYQCGPFVTFKRSFSSTLNCVWRAGGKNAWILVNWHLLSMVFIFVRKTSVLHVFGFWIVDCEHSKLALYCIVLLTRCCIGPWALCLQMFSSIVCFLCFISPHFRTFLPETLNWCEFSMLQLTDNGPWQLVT